MPTLCSFYGILIQMFWQDHAPPHFHALYAEHEALTTSGRWKWSAGISHVGRMPWCSSGRMSIAPN